MPPSQAGRILSVSTPLGEDVLLLRSMSGSERLGAPFEYELELASPNIDISPDDLLGKPSTVSLQLPDGSKRYFNGYMSRFSQVGFDGADALYRARLSPWVWFLSRTADCRIFQDQTVPDIVKGIFREHGFTDFEERLTGDYRTWGYCVQYRETDLNFVNRLLEQEGIYYFFEHQEDKHLLILADSYSAHSLVPGYEEVPYHPPDDTAAVGQEHIYDWTVAQQVSSGAFANTAFDFTAPRKDLLATRSGPKNHELADYELFDYAGDYTQGSEGTEYARIRLEEAQAGHELAEAQSNARGLGVGALFKMAEYRREDQNREYLVASAQYHLRSDLFGSGANSLGGPPCQCNLSVIDSQVPYRPPRITPKPIVQGPQTAVVTGKSGEEIWTDKYGRVKVQFHWDRYGKRDENSSCWVRVSHPWAGKGWGAVAIPRIGQEVVVSFLEGDPDRPLITGRVYNGDCMPPYGLPGSAVISGLKSNSTKGGGGYNEYVMDDTKGNELIREHGQYDKDSTIENDLRERVLNNRSRDVAVDETIFIGNNQSQTIGVDQTENIGSNQAYSIGANQTGTVGANRSVTIGANDTESVAANQAVNVGASKTETIAIVYALTVGAAMNQAVGAALAQEVGGAKIVSVGAVSSENIGASKSVNAGASISEQAGSNFSAQAGGTMSLKSGDDLSAVSGAKALVSAASELVLKCGSSEIVMKSGGDITIKGSSITIKASGKLTAKAGGDMILKGSSIKENS